jgi:hypothetical protein
MEIIQVDVVLFKIGKRRVRIKIICLKQVQQVQLSAPIGLSNNGLIKLKIVTT